MKHKIEVRKDGRTFVVRCNSAKATNHVRNLLDVEELAEWARNLECCERAAKVRVGWRVKSLLGWGTVVEKPRNGYGCLLVRFDTDPPLEYNLGENPCVMLDTWCDDAIAPGEDRKEE